MERGQAMAMTAWWNMKAIIKMERKAERGKSITREPQRCDIRDLIKTTYITGTESYIWKMGN